MWNHKGHVIIGGESVDGLAFEFDIVKTLGPTFDVATVRVHNVAPTRGERLVRLISFSDQKTELQVWGGYEDTGVSRLYRGNVARATYTRGDNTVLALECSDTGNGSHFIYASESVTGAFAVEDLVRTLVDNLGADPGGLETALATPAWKLWSTSQIAPNATLTPGYMTDDTIVETLTTIFRSAGMRWTIRDGVFEAWALGTTLGVGAPRPVNRTTGMLGSPVRTSPPGLVVRHTLQGAFRVGDLVGVTARDIPAFTGRLDVVRHTGVSDGDDWTTELQIADATKLKEHDDYAP